MNLPAIDTLCANVDIENYENSASELLDFLEQKKSEALSVAANNASEKLLIEISSVTFEILPNGSKGYAYILHNDDYEVKLCKYIPKMDNFYPVFIKIKSSCLWSNGIEHSWSFIKNWIHDSIGQVISNKINRLDPCCHTDELELQLSDLDNFKGKYHVDNIGRERGKINFFTFGTRNSRNIYCRIYDKSLEISKSNKLWFVDIWINEGLNIEKVFNVEFELKRKFFKDRNIESVEDVIARIRDIWDYCTKEWVVMVNNNRTRIERCSINSTWEKIQNSFINFNGIGKISKKLQLKRNAEILIPQSVGDITSFGALYGITDVEKLFDLIKEKGINYLSNKKMNYEMVIQKKMKLQNNEKEVL